MGAVASTFIAGVLAARKGLTPPIGSLSQMARIEVGSGADRAERLIRDVVPLAGLDDLVFGGWDPISTNMLEAARTARVLDRDDLEPLAAELEAIVPMAAVFDKRWVSRLEGVRVKPQTSKWEQAEALVDDIRRFKAEHRCDRLVMVWCGSTEAFQEPSEVHATAAAFAQGLKDNDANIAPSQIYAWAALQCRVPFANGAPNLTVDLPCMIEAAERRGVPMAGKDFKTGQTWMKTLVAPGLKARMLGLRGWYSTNILGNRDGEVLDAPENFKSKEVSKLGVLDTILEPERTRTSTATSTTSSASTTTRRAATTRKAGTTSTSSDGSAIRCRSRSTSSAATRFSPRPSCSTWRSSSTWPIGRARRRAGVALVLPQGAAVGRRDAGAA